MPRIRAPACPSSYALRDRVTGLGQRDAEAGPWALAIEDFDRSPMLVDDLLHEGEAEAYAVVSYLRELLDG